MTTATPLAVYGPDEHGTPRPGAVVTLAGAEVATVTAMDAQGRALVAPSTEVSAKVARRIAAGRYLVARVHDDAAILVAR